MADVLGSCWVIYSKADIGENSQKQGGFSGRRTVWGTQINDVDSLITSDGNQRSFHYQLLGAL